MLQLLWLFYKHLRVGKLFYCVGHFGYWDLKDDTFRENQTRLPVDGRRLFGHVLDMVFQILLALEP